MEAGPVSVYLIGSLPLDVICISPEHFKIVVCPCVGLEEVDHDVDEVDQEPCCAGVDAFAKGVELVLLGEIFNVFDHAFHLAIRGAAADDDEIGDLADAADIEHEDVFALVVIEKASGFDCKPACQSRVGLGPGWEFTRQGLFRRLVWHRPRIARFCPGHQQKTGVQRQTGDWMRAGRPDILGPWQIHTLSLGLWMW